MYLKNIQINNIGPIKNINYESPFFENGNPKPIIFVGKNGSGKSILLSYIVDSFFEFKREYYEDIEIKEGKLYKIQSLSYIRSYEDIGWVNLEYIHKADSLFLTEVLSSIPSNEFAERYKGIKIPHFNVDNERFKKFGLFLDRSTGENVKKAIDESIILYFPDGRFENPAWLNEAAFKEKKIVSKPKFISESRRKVIVTDTLEDLESWLLDIILDKCLYETPFTMETQKGINNIIKEMFKSKYPQKQGLRFGISSRKQGRRIGIYNDFRNGQGQNKIEQIAPTLYHLSSGESALLVLFSAILKDYDVISSEEATFTLENIEGVVVVDEIEQHLHIELQRYVLPRLIKLFPKIQFIIATQSPFFLAGMKDIFGNDTDIINLPEGELITVENFSEFTEALEIFNNEGAKFKKELDSLKVKLNEIISPLIITEGKSDWKHLKKAKEKLNIGDNFVFYEYDTDMGDKELLKLCKAYTKLPNDKPLIFIFDRDNSQIIKEVCNEGKDFKSWGNNIFSFAIPIPERRKDYERISIEFYYSDEEIKKEDSYGRRLFLSSEFREKSGLHKHSPNIKIGNATKLKEITEEKKSKIIDSDVFNEKDENIALSKSDFADYVFKDIPPFNSFNFDEFRKIFDVIKNILNE